MKIFTLMAALLVFPSFAKADTNYLVDKEKSEIAFSGTHAGNEFSGVFEEWNAEIIFNENSLDESKLKAVIMPKSAVTGNKMYDGTLPQSDWFNVKQYPEIVFESNSIEALAEKNAYRANGTLNIRGQEEPFSFDFNVSDLIDGMRTANAEFPIDRIKYGIGVKSDKDAEWVSREIILSLDINASVDSTTAGE